MSRPEAPSFEIQAGLYEKARSMIGIMHSARLKRSDDPTRDALFLAVNLFVLRKGPIAKRKAYVNNVSKRLKGDVTEGDPKINIVRQIELDLNQILEIPIDELPRISTSI